MKGISKLVINRNMRFFTKYFARSHEWIEKSKEGNHYIIGITHYAQSKLGEVVYLQFPEVDHKYHKGEDLGEIESPKAVSSIYAPVDLTVIENNNELENDFGVINKDANNTWFYKVKIDNEQQLKELLNEKDYKNICVSLE